jgi:predicted Zn-dependent peptidase
MIYKKTSFDNGTRLITERVAHAKSISLGIWVDAGSRDEEEDNRGIFHLIEHMIFKGTKTKSAIQIAKDLDLIGGVSNAFTSKEQTCFYARVLDKHLQLLIDLLSDIFINSIFAEKDLGLEKAVVLQEISMMEDTPDEYVQVLFDQNFWRDDPLGRSILGTRETVNKIKREDIIKYWSHFYSPMRVVIAAAGNVDHDALIDSFRPFFEPLSNKRGVPFTRSTVLSRPMVSSHPKQLEQVHLCLGATASSLAGEERYAEAALNTILGGNMSSRLFQEIREKRGLAYSVYSHINSYIDTGIIKIYLATDKGEINRVLELIGQLIKDIQNGDLTENDITQAKEYLTGGILLGTENMDILMTRLARNEFVFGRHISHDELIARLEKVTLEEVIEASRRIFAPGAISMTVLGPIESEEIAVDPLNI